jgi:hypothetical protein
MNVPLPSVRVWFCAVPPGKLHASAEARIVQQHLVAHARGPVGHGP